jgi:protoheme IX farnesyltransferase
MSEGRVQIPGEEPSGEDVPSFFADLMVLTKVRLSFLVLVTTVTGFWYAKILANSGGAEGMVWTAGNVLSCFHTLVGTALAAFSAAALNQSYEGEVDSRMERTRDRPVPAGRIESGKVFRLGAVLGALGVVYLAWFSGWKTAALGALTILIYVWVYTPMKQRSFAAVYVGAVSGALPPLMGWVAGDGKGWWGGGCSSGFCSSGKCRIFWRLLGCTVTSTRQRV